jgi:hypothetical protein
MTDDRNELLLYARSVRDDILAVIANTPPEQAMPALMSLLLEIGRRYPELTSMTAQICIDMALDLDASAAIAGMPAF